MYVNLDGLREMDADEVEYVKSCVASLFGPFDTRVAIDGVFFYSERTPTTVYPAPSNRFLISVVIPEHQSDDFGRLAHLSHELVHCLCPNGLPGGQATVLEEGLGEHAKVYLCRAHFEQDYPDFDFKNLCGVPGPYLEAFNLIEEVVAHEGMEEMRESIRRMRASLGIPFAQITSDQLATFLTRTPHELLERLSKRFSD